MVFFPKLFSISFCLFKTSGRKGKKRASVMSDFVHHPKRHRSSLFPASKTDGDHNESSAHCSSNVEEKGTKRASHLGDFVVPNENPKRQQSSLLPASKTDGVHSESTARSSSNVEEKTVEADIICFPDVQIIRSGESSSSSGLSRANSRANDRENPFAGVLLGTSK